jgi:predicted phage terminase large subunit-like protein
MTVAFDLRSVNRNQFPDDLANLETIGHTNAAENFATYRRAMHPGRLWGWWPQLVSDQLQIFYDDMVAGRRPKLVLQAPPQHGKSVAAEDFVSWLAGRNPELKTIFASHSDELGIVRNLGIQRTMRSDAYRAVFPKTVIGQQGFICNTTLIEYGAGHRGSFRNTTVRGSINGMELHFGLIDDPVKGRQEANSKVNRDSVWSWFTDDFFARFATNSAMLFIMTRWHLDDVLGRYITHAKKHRENLRLLRFPALAEIDGRYRLKGEPLFPQFKDRAHLLERKRLMTHASWEAEYQQNPILVGGGVLPIEKIRVIPIFDRREIKRSVRAVDKAGTDDAGAYTAAVLMHQMKDGRYVIEDVVRGQWSALERERTLKTVCDADRSWLGRLGIVYKVVIEQEPGSGGKESAEATSRNLAGHRVILYKPTGSKEVRAEPFACQVQNGNMWLVAGAWVQDFLTEAETWPQSQYLDQIDAASMAFNELTQGSRYDLSSWMDDR